MLERLEIPNVQVFLHVVNVASLASRKQIQRRGVLPNSQARFHPLLRASLTQLTHVHSMGVSGSVRQCQTGGVKSRNRFLLAVSGSLRVLNGDEVRYFNWLASLVIAALKLFSAAQKLFNVAHIALCPPLVQCSD